MPDDTLDIFAAAKACRVSYDTVRGWINSGELPARRIDARGRPYRIRRLDLRAVMTARNIPTDALDRLESTR